MGENTRSITNWSELLPKEEWDKYVPLMSRAQDEGIKYALGGGLAFCEYSGRMRNTKDIDLFILEKDRDRLIEIISEEGWEDYYSEHDYDRSWIYRGFKDGLIVDLIWRMPNHRRNVEASWLSGAGQVEIYGRWIRLLPLEHMLVSKLYVMQRERCDWPDMLNMLNFSIQRIRWRPLLKMLQEDAPLFGGLLAAFRWLEPEKAKTIPLYVWEGVGLMPELPNAEGIQEDRAFLLDTRDWFGPTP